MLDGYQRIYRLSADQISPFAVVCWFSHDVRHLEFVSPEETGLEVKQWDR